MATVICPDVAAAVHVGARTAAIAVGEHCRRRRSLCYSHRRSNCTSSVLDCTADSCDAGGTATTASPARITATASVVRITAGASFAWITAAFSVARGTATGDGHGILSVTAWQLVCHN